MATATRSTGYAQRPGVALIINQRDYGGAGGDRVGTDADRKSLEDLFNVMSYELMIVDDCEPHELLEYIEDAVGLFDRDHDGPFFLCILAHGEKESIAFKGKHTIETATILDHMEGLRQLHGKPKIVIIEACRGTDLMTLSRDGAAEARPSTYFGIDGSTGRRDPAADFLVFWSCLQGRVSYIHPKLGSWFINVLCDSILRWFCMNPKQPLPFLSITPVVNRLMLEPFYFRGKNGRGEQVFKTTEIRHSLTAELLLSPAPGARGLLEPAARRVRDIQAKLRAISQDPNSASPPASNQQAASASTSASVDVLTRRVQTLALGGAAAAQPARAPVRKAAALAARHDEDADEDTDEDVVCQCRAGCRDRRCPCDRAGVACVAECHGGESCTNTHNCRCEKGDCRTNKCGCFKDGWYCDEGCHRGFVVPNCRNPKPGRRRRRARE